LHFTARLTAPFPPEHRSLGTTQSEGSYESIWSEDGDIGQQANYPRDLGTSVYRQDADADAEGRNSGQQPLLWDNATEAAAATSPTISICC